MYFILFSQTANHTCHAKGTELDLSLILKYHGWLEERKSRKRVKGGSNKSLRKSNIFPYSWFEIIGQRSTAKVAHKQSSAF